MIQDVVNVVLIYLEDLKSLSTEGGKEVKPAEGVVECKECKRLQKVIEDLNKILH
jgi:hypothetical protein